MPAHLIRVLLHFLLPSLVKAECVLLALSYRVAIRPVTVPHSPSLPIWMDLYGLSLLSTSCQFIQEVLGASFIIHLCHLWPWPGGCHHFHCPVSICTGQKKDDDSRRAKTTTMKRQFRHFIRSTLSGQHITGGEVAPRKAAHGVHSATLK